MKLLDHFINECTTEEKDGFKYFDREKFARLITQHNIRCFGQTRTEPSLETYCLQRLGIEE